MAWSWIHSTSPTPESLPLYSHRHPCVHTSHLRLRVFHQELELLIPHWGAVHPRTTGVIFATGLYCLLAQRQTAVRVALPREAPHRKIACTAQRHGKLALCK